MGLGGIFIFTLVCFAVATWVGQMGPTEDLYEARLAVGLAVPKDVPPAERDKRNAEMDKVYQGLGYADRHAKLTLNELRGIVRKRKAV